MRPVKRRAGKHTSRAIDWACNGVPVYIRRRPADGRVYATTFDFSKFVTEPPLETLRVRVGDIDDLRLWTPENDPVVVEALARYK